MQTTLPIARYRFTAQVQQPLALPDYAGSLLRGQFGAALRNVACMTRQPTCHGCPLQQSCPYTRIFEAAPPAKGYHALQDFSRIPNAYVLEPPKPGARLLEAGNNLEFHLVLIGHATEQLALVVFAMQRALAQGLTRDRVPTQLLRVDWIDPEGPAIPVWTEQHPLLLAHNATVTIAAPELVAAIAHQQGATSQNDHYIALSIHTPLRLQSQGKPLGVGQLTPRALIAAIARRTALLMEFHAGSLPTGEEQHNWGEAAKNATQLASNLTDTQQLHWFDWMRYSSRQQQQMSLGGVLGTWTLHGSAQDLAQLWPWLWLGQWLHVGKNATMGLGGYCLSAR